MIHGKSRVIIDGRDGGAIAWFVSIATVVGVVVLAYSCALDRSPQVDPGYSDVDCTRPRQSIEGTVVQNCYVEPSDGFAACKYRVVHTPRGCECREWRVRKSCKAQWDHVAIDCVCSETERVE